MIFIGYYGIINLYHAIRGICYVSIKRRQGFNDGRTHI